MFKDYSRGIMGALAVRWARLERAGGFAARARLEEVVGEDAVESFRYAAASLNASTASSPTPRLDALYERAHRRRQGMYFTPTPWADFMASALELWAPSPQDAPWHVADLAAGDGALLCAAIRARPDCVVLGVEQEPASALMAAMHIIEARIAQGSAWDAPLSDRVMVGSGLMRDVLPVEQVEVILGNPPYLGEKGNKAFFEALASSHPHLAPRIVARVDLLYLFMYRALDMLASGGVMVHLTSAYWLQATGAATLRRELLRRARPRLFWQKPDERLFADAPGHHSLLSIWQKRARPLEVSEACEAVAYSARDDDTGASGVAHAFEHGTACVLADSSAGFRPFVNREDFAHAQAFAARSTRFEDVFQDAQGFVSGADRVTRAHTKIVEALEVGDPLFLFDDLLQIPHALEPWRGDLVLPVMRAGQITASQIWHEVDPEACAWVLYIDGVLEGERLEVVEAHLEQARPVLERRREVRIGRIPWYRMHWPRQRTEQLGDKLVMARRGATWCVAADFAGHTVSSDCTYVRLERSTGKEADRRSLIRALIWFEQEEVARDLQVYGKQKGELYEFYSEPLRRVPVALERDGNGELVFDERVLGKHRALALERQMWERIERQFAHGLEM